MIFQIQNKNVYASDAGQGIDENKETIVFIHGSGLSHIVWSLTEQFFSSKNFNVLSIDLPGHGNSDGPCLDSIEKIADWLEKVFEELKLKNIILVGHSQGCLEALEYSFRYKERLKDTDIVVPDIPENITMTWWQYIVALPKGTDLVLRTSFCQTLLEEHNVPTANAYWPACHEQSAFLDYVKGYEYPVADDLLHRHVALPMYYEMDLEQVDYVCDSIIKILNDR